MAVAVWRGRATTQLRGLPGWTDALIAATIMLGVVLGTSAAATVQAAPRPLDAWADLLVALATALLAWRRVAPLVALTGVIAGVGLYLLCGYPYGPIQLCMVIAMFEVARQRALPVSLGACVLAALAAVGAVLPRLTLRAEHGSDPPFLLMGAWAGWLVVPWALGALVHVRAVAEERLRRDLIARATLEERMWLAQEVHDGAGHGLAVIALQAGVALLVLNERPDQARASLEAIRATSTQALDDLRATLDTVHQGGPGALAAAAPRTNAAPDATGYDWPELKALLERVRAAGLPVDFEVTGAATAPSRDIAIATYRIVQEALTNVLRHAGPTRALVRLTGEGTALVIEVADRGRGPGGSPRDEGRGLNGIRARVAARGGQLAVGQREDGGFRVLARLPHGAEGA